MSFIATHSGHAFEAGGFVAAGDESITRETMTVSASHAQAVTTAEGTKYVPAGAVIPANDATAKGLLYEDIDVTTGNMPGSVVTSGKVYADRLPAAIAAAAASAMPGITVVATAPAVTRPY